ncbi:MAG: hypothetical protein H6625_14295, partial [Bdellovibrionaceae bacterium]|nr:hypothetical protein [Pseudobdellovibrionaceae bacterium]
RVEPNSTLFSGSSRSTSRSSDKILFSFAIAIRNVNGDIVTASTEDRQWAVAKVGQCVQAKVFPYPPWDLEKAGTFFGARLKNLSDCNPKDWPKNLQPTQPAHSEQPVIQEPIQPSNSLHENSKSLNNESVEDKSNDIESSVE